MSEPDTGWKFVPGALLSFPVFQFSKVRMAFLSNAVGLIKTALHRKAIENLA